MGEFAKMFNLFACHTRGSHGLRKQLSTCLKRPLVCVSYLSCDRSAHTQAITRNIKHISNDKIKLSVDPQTMKCAAPINKPMCIMLSWLLSKPKHVLKYAELYLEQGYDVISVSCTPWQLMRPMDGVKLEVKEVDVIVLKEAKNVDLNYERFLSWQVVARDLIKFMSQNGDKFVVHGFSVGGYIWSEGLVYAVNNKKLYQPVLDRVEAQVWDSVADLTAVTVGVPHALFPNNKLLRTTLYSTLELYLKVFSSVTAQYKLASDTYYSTPCRAPGLFLLSSSDPVGAETNIQNAHDTWLQMGIKCTWKCWENSPHVLHYMHHPDEYRDLLLAHLREHTTAVRPAISDIQETMPEQSRATA